MKRFTNRFWRITVAALLLFVVSTGAASALSPASPYKYTDTGYQTIVDSGGNRFSFATTGCGFHEQTDTIRQSHAYDPAKITVEGSAYCDNDDGTTRPADAYWASEDRHDYVVMLGSNAAALNKPSQSGIAGQAKLAVFGNNDQLEEIHDITIDNKTVTGAPVGSTASSESEFDNNCRQEAGTFSWLACPLINKANDFVKRLVGYVLDLLKTEPLLLNTHDDNDGKYTRSEGLYDAWSQFRTIANILLIPLFLISIYAMLFSANNRYTVTRVLPRLVVAALAMQLSFFFAAIIIDLGNVLAAGIAGIFNFVNQNIEAGMVESLNRPELLTGTAADRGVGAAVGTGLAVALGWLFIFAATPPGIIVLTTFVVGIILTFLALALRQLAIVIFVVLAPIAMVMGVLPNTERWMREWFDNLIKLVLIYPLITLFFAVSSTLSLLALGTGQAEINMIVASLLPVVALVSVPLIFKFAGTLFRNVTAALSGVSGRVKGGIVGDIRDPGSLAFKSRMSKTWRRYQNTKRVAGVPGLGWTAWATQPIRKERDYYRMGGESAAEIFSAAFPDKLKRLIYGERPFNGRLGVENYTPKNILDTNWAKRDIVRIRHTNAEMSAVMGGPAAQHLAGNFDRGVAAVYGLASMVQDGSMPFDNAAEALTTLQFSTRPAQRWISFVKPEDLRDPYLGRSPTHMYQGLFGSDWQTLPVTNQQVNLDRKRQLLMTNAGTLLDQQGEGSFKVVADALSDERIIAEARTNADLYGSIQALAIKAQALSARSAQAESQYMATQGGEEGDGGASAGGFYGKAGVEIRAMREFMQQAQRARDALGIDLTEIPPDPAV